MNLEIDIEEPWPASADWADLAERAAEALQESAPELANPRLLASVLFTSDAEVHVLNREWRGKDKPTNVLSFPAPESAFPHLGDIVLAYGVCATEAEAQGRYGLGTARTPADLGVNERRALCAAAHAAGRAAMRAGRG